jgi:hypothetical protein
VTSGRERTWEGKRSSRSEFVFSICALQIVSLESFVLAGLIPGLPFRFILRVYDAQRSKGPQAWILLFVWIDIGEVFFISLPEEIIESVDEYPDFPSGLDFLLGFHLFSFLYEPSRFLTLENYSFCLGAWMRKIVNKYGRRQTVEVDTVVLVCGFIPNTNLLGGP